MDNPSGFRVEWTKEKMGSTLLGRIAWMLQQRVLVDVTLSCDDFKVKCHRLILAACSPYFADILSKSSSPDLVICLVGVKKWHICTLLAFMYTGVIENITKDKFEELCKVANRLKIHGLCNQGEASMMGSKFGERPTLSGNQYNAEPILIDLVDGDSSVSGSGRSDSDGEVDPDPGSSERNDIFSDGNDQEGLPSRLPMVKPFKKRQVIVSNGNEGTVAADGIQPSENGGIAPNAGAEVAGSGMTQNEQDVGNSTKKMKMDQKESCETDSGSNGSGLDPNILLGLGLQSDERAEDLVRTTQLHIETKVKQVRRKRGRPSKISSLPSQPVIQVHPENITVGRFEEVHLQNFHQPLVFPGSSVNPSQAPPLGLNFAEVESSWINRLLVATYIILYGHGIDQASLSSGIPVAFLVEYLRRHGGAQHTGQEEISTNSTENNEQFRTFVERELQECAKRIHEQMLFACWSNMSVLQGQSSSNPNPNVSQKE